MVLARRQREVGESVDVKFVPDSPQIFRFIELHLIRDHSSAELLVGGVLQIPPSLVLLHELADKRPLLITRALRFDSAPDLQIFGRIAVVILCRTLPGDDVRSQRRKAELEHVGCWERRDDVTDGGVNDRNPESGQLER